MSSPQDQTSPSPNPPSKTFTEFITIATESKFSALQAFLTTNSNLSVVLTFIIDYTNSNNTNKKKRKHPTFHDEDEDKDEEQPIFQIAKLPITAQRNLLTFFHTSLTTSPKPKPTQTVTLSTLNVINRYLQIYVNGGIDCDVWCLRILHIILVGFKGFNVDVVEGSKHSISISEIFSRECMYVVDCIRCHLKVLDPTSDGAVIANVNVNANAKSIENDNDVTTTSIVGNENMFFLNDEGNSFTSTGAPYKIQTKAVEVGKLGQSQDQHDFEPKEKETVTPSLTPVSPTLSSTLISKIVNHLLTSNDDESESEIEIDRSYVNVLINLICEGIECIGSAGIEAVFDLFLRESALPSALLITMLTKSFLENNSLSSITLTKQYILHFLVPTLTSDDFKVCRNVTGCLEDLCNASGSVSVDDEVCVFLVFKLMTSSSSKSNLSAQTCNVVLNLLTKVKGLTTSSKCDLFDKLCIIGGDNSESENECFQITTITIPVLINLITSCACITSKNLPLLLNMINATVTKAPTMSKSLPLAKFILQLANCANIGVIISESGSGCMGEFEGVVERLEGFMKGSIGNCLRKLKN